MTAKLTHKQRIALQGITQPYYYHPAARQQLRDLDCFGPLAELLYENIAECVRRDFRRLRVLAKTVTVIG